MDDYVRKFNNKIRELLTVLESDLPKDADMETIQRKFRLAISIDRTCIIEESTHELLEYRDYIVNDRLDELVNMDWTKKINDRVSIEKTIVDKHSIMEMVALLRNLWTTYDDEQKTFIRKSLKHLLNYCIKYHKVKSM